MPNDSIRQQSNWADYLISIFGGFKLRNKTAIDSLYRIRTWAGTEISVSARVYFLEVNSVRG